MAWRLTNLNDTEDPAKDEWAVIINGETVFTAKTRASAKARLTKIVGPASDSTPEYWSVPKGGKDPWLWTAGQIYAAMPDDRWCHFGEYDNTTAVMELVRKGRLELNPDKNNRIFGMVTSLYARKVMPPPARKDE
jgi:hypothetical protein